MGLFGKKKEKKSCCCGDSCTPEKMAQAETAKTTAGVKVLGSGCAKCHALEEAARAAGRGPKDLAIQPSTRSATFFAQEGKRLFCRREGKGSLTLRSHETFAGAGCFGGPATLLPAVCTVIPYDRWGLSLLRVSGQLRNS